MDLRAAIVSRLPYDVRLVGSLAQRSLQGAGGRGSRLAKVPETAFPPVTWCAATYRFDNAPAEELRSLRRAAEDVHGLMLPPGGVFWFWRTVRRLPGMRRYRSGLRQRGRHQEVETVDALSLLSTALYSLALQGGMEIVERHSHEHRAPGLLGTFEPGRDASVEYGFRDLRFRNTQGTPVVLSIKVFEWELSAAMLAATPCTFDVTFDEVVEQLPPPTLVISDPGMRPGSERVIAHGAPGYFVQTERVIVYGNGDRRADRLPDSQYEPVDTVVGRGPIAREDATARQR